MQSVQQHYQEIKNLRKQQETQSKLLKEQEHQINEVYKNNLSLSFELVQLEKKLNEVLFQLDYEQFSEEAYSSVYKSNPPDLGSMLRELEIDKEEIEVSVNSPLYKSNQEIQIELTKSFEIPLEPEDFGTYTEPLSNPSTHDILRAARFLGIDPANETSYLYVARAFLQKPIPNNWKLSDNLFVNLETGETTSEHPGVQHYLQLISKIKSREQKTVQSLRQVLLDPACVMMQHKYKCGIQSFFEVEDKKFLGKRREIEERVNLMMSRKKDVKVEDIQVIEEERTKKKAQHPLFSWVFDDSAAKLKQLWDNLTFQ